MSTTHTTKTRTAKSKKKGTTTGITWSEARDLYETALRAARKSPGTISGYLQEIDGFERRGPASPATVTVQHLREHLVGLHTGKTSRSGRPNGAGNIGKVATALSAFFTFLHDEDVIPDNPSRRLERPRVPEKLPGDVLTPKEIEKLLRACDSATPLGQRDRALIEALYAMGLRNAEVLGLDLTDLSHADREVSVVGKGDKGRVIPLIRSAWNVVRDYINRARPTLATTHPDSARAIFLNYKGERLSKEGLRVILHRLKAATGIKKRITPHTFRRSFATALLKNGVDLRTIQVLLGHEHLNTTARYLRLDTRDLRRDLLLHHPRERIEV